MYQVKAGHQASEQQIVLSLFYPVYSSQLVGVAIVHHDVGKKTCNSTCSKYKSFALHKLQLDPLQELHKHL